MLKALVQKFVRSMGFEVNRVATHYAQDERTIMKKVEGYTATGPGRIVGLVDAVKYLSSNKIEGAIVECGVWRGGSSMAALLALKDLGDTSREVYLYDTFEGMSAPTDKDVVFDGTPAKTLLNAEDRREDVANTWCYAGVEMVRRNVLTTGYPAEKLHLIKGKVEDTIPKEVPRKIALLRLDTDWYESTRHELHHLWPLLVPQGVMIIDDYGHWQGARRAVDEFFASASFHPLLSRLDYTGRMVVKTTKDY